MTDALTINAWAGFSVQSTLNENFNVWVANEFPVPLLSLAPDKPPKPQDWNDENVGWGLVLPDIEGATAAVRATADDAPEPMQRLLAHRHGVVLRWRPSPSLNINKLTRCYADGSEQDVDIAASARGTARGSLPSYLLLCGSPVVLPWELQYRLNAVAYTGRLDLDEVGLENYVSAVESGWENNPAEGNNALIWAVDHHGGDITSLMRTVVAGKVHGEYHSDDEMDTVFIDGSQEEATHQRLLESLTENQPGMVLTTSHGMTGPLDNIDLMRQQMGLPVDSSHQALDMDVLLNNWHPNGAIWYSHACCSAGCDSRTAFAGLVDENGDIAKILNGVAQCGALTAPLPKRLLSAVKPLRAFIGQVEPTFNWTLKDTQTGQWLTNPLAKALYERLFQPWPIGYAFESFHRMGPVLEQLRNRAMSDSLENSDPATREASLKLALRLKLIAQDMQSTVILGDPAEALQR